MAAMTTDMEWNDGIGPRGRGAWLLLIRGDNVRAYGGSNGGNLVTEAGLVALRGTSYQKNGKWSSTTYRLTLAPSVREIHGMDGWEQGTFAEGLAAVTRSEPIDRWDQMATALGVTIGAAQTFLRAWRPKAAEKLDATEAALVAVDEIAGPGGATEVAISFGSPTNRVAGEGFWDWPIIVRGPSSGEVGRLTPDTETKPNSGEYVHPHGWRVDGPIRILACERSRGYHGGTISMRLAVPDGCIASHERPATA